MTADPGPPAPGAPSGGPADGAPLPLAAPGEALGLVRRRLASAFAAAGLDSPEADARALLAGVLDRAPIALVTHADAVLDPDEAARVAAAAARRLAREPVARILGARAFWSLRLALGPATLVPRPETEHVVEAALARTRAAIGPRIADLGTGSGALLLACLSERPDACGLGLDRDPAAVAVARANAEAHGLHARALFLVGDWAAALAPSAFDLILANPPYVARAALADLAPEVRGHDPLPALDGGEDGLEAYRALLPGASLALRPGAALVLEIGEDQGESVPALARAAGLAVEAVRCDLAGHPRVAILCRPP